MFIYLLRHGDAVENPSLRDAERPLTDLGVQQAAFAARFLKADGVKIEVILTSPLLRARQTASIIQDAMKIEAVRTSEHLSPSSDHRQLFQTMNEQNVESILLVGHEPHLSTAISLLIVGGRDAKIEIKKASLACVETQRPIEMNQGHLKWLITANQMKLVS